MSRPSAAGETPPETARTGLRGWVHLAGSPYRGLLAEGPFRRLALGFATSYVGDGMSAVAVAWLALGIAPAGRQGLAVGATLAAYALPGIALGFLPGIGARFRSGVLIAANGLLRAGCLGAIVPLAYTHSLTLGLYVALVGASSLLSAWGVAGRYALVAQVVPEEGRMAANALLSTLMQTGLIAGPAIAGALAATVGPAAALGLDAASWALLAWLALSVRAGRLPAAVAEEDRVAGWRLLWRSRPLRRLLVLTAWFFFLYGPVEAALPLYVRHDLAGSAALLGGFWTAFGVAASVGGLLAGLLRPERLWGAALAIVVGWGLALLPLGVSHLLPLAIVAFAVGGAVYGPYPAVTATLLQREAPPSRLAAVGAAWGAVSIASTPLGTAVGGPIVDAIGPQRTLLLSAVATIALAPAVLLVLRLDAGRQRRRCVS